MILDHLDQAPTYAPLHPSFPKAFAWLSSYDPETPDGRYEIGGPELEAIVSRYATAPAAGKNWETHRLHGDIQFMVSGAELIGYAPRESLRISTPYDVEKDAEFYDPPSGEITRFTLAKGSFAVFLPQDAHQPGVMLEAPAEVHKVVIKFRL
jgi:YhcH/YjgK/YiaL family protein